MRAAAGPLAALLLLVPLGCFRGTPGARDMRVRAGATEVRAHSTAPTGTHLPDTLSHAQLAAALRAMRLRPAPGGRVVNDCDEAVRPESHPVDLGGSVGRAWLVEVGGGPRMLTCYGNAGVAFWLLRKRGEDFHVILADYGLLAVLSTVHHNVKDLAIGGPGFRFPVFVWEDSAYRRRGWIPDSLMPPPVH